MSVPLSHALPDMTPCTNVRNGWKDTGNGWYRPVHAKSASAQELRALLTARKRIQAKLLDVESGVRGVLRGFGFKVGSISRGRFEMRIRDLIGLPLPLTV
jgi:transposase